MASLFRTASSGFCVQWTVGRNRDGKLVRDSRTFGSKAEAIAFKVGLEEMKTGTGKESLTARGLAWVDDREKIGKITAKTAVGYREKLRAWGALLGLKPYKKIAVADIERAYADLASGQTPTGRKPSARTLHHYRTALATFFNAMEAKARLGEIQCAASRGRAGLRRGQGAHRPSRN